jgi:hypothetical protein
MICPSCGHSFNPPLRTTGERSQNHAIFGLADQIAKWYEDGTSKWDVLDEAMHRAGFSSHVNRFGRIVYDKHESQLTKAEASLVIDKLKEIAVDMEIPLVEVNE